MSLQFIRFRSFACSVRLRNLREDCSNVGLYCVIITWQRIFKQGFQVVPNLANIGKNHCFPKNLPIFLAIFLNSKYLPFLKYEL